MKQVKRIITGHTLRALLLLIGLTWISLQPARAYELADIQRDRGSFAWGFFSGIVAHELGHLLIADALGYESEFDGVTIVYPDANLEGAELVQISSAGYQAQWLASELAFWYRQRPNLSVAADNYSVGVIAAHIAISAAYMTFLRNHEDGDIKGLSKATGVPEAQVALTMAIPAMLDTWRLFGDNPPAWLPTVSAGSKALGFTWIWTFD